MRSKPDLVPRAPTNRGKGEPFPTTTTPAEETAVPDRELWEAWYRAYSPLQPREESELAVLRTQEATHDSKSISIAGALVHRYTPVPRTLNFHSDLVNDRNQDLCGGWDPCIGPGDSDATLIQRVLDGRKPMGEGIWTFDPAEQNNLESRSGMRHASYLRTVERVTASGLPFHVSELTRSENGSLRGTILVARPGTFDELFDLQSLAADYVSAWPGGKAMIERDMADIHGKPLIEVGSPTAPPRMDRWSSVSTPIRGLALGYPIENTLAFMLA